MTNSNTSQSRVRLVKWISPLNLKYQNVYNTMWVLLSKNFDLLFFFLAKLDATIFNIIEDSACFLRPVSQCVVKQRFCRSVVSPDDNNITGEKEIEGGGGLFLLSYVFLMHGQISNFLRIKTWDTTRNKARYALLLILPVIARTLSFLKLSFIHAKLFMVIWSQI